MIFATFAFLAVCVLSYPNRFVDAKINNSLLHDNRLNIMSCIDNNMIQDLLNRYAELLKEFFGERLLSAAVFGSVARGTAKFPQSDIDVLTVLEGIEKLSLGERLKLTGKVEEELSKTRAYKEFKDVSGRRPHIQEIIFSPEELRAHPPILLDMTSDVIILHDTGILRQELDKLKKRLQELGARRVVRGDSWFWILKPDLKPGEIVEL